jgi:hypothetical protein
MAEQTPGEGLPKIPLHERGQPLTRGVVRQRKKGRKRGPDRFVQGRLSRTSAPIDRGPVGRRSIGRSVGVSLAMEASDGHSPEWSHRNLRGYRVKDHEPAEVEGGRQEG